jgi:glycosyltransferase involved in cell wall biosynthesis
MPEAALTLSICIFAWDEVATLRTVVDSHREALARIGAPYEIVIIDDGSTDGTSEEADRIAAEHPHVRVVHHGDNRGLGGVYRTTFLEARGTFATFYPADGQFPAELLERYYPLAEDWDLLLGNLPKRRDSLLGAALGKMERILYRAAFGEMPRLEGVFMVRTSVLRDITLKSEGRGWTLVWELVLRAQRQGYRITGVPVFIKPRTHGTSKVTNVKNVFANLKQLAQLRKLL